MQSQRLELSALLPNSAITDTADQTFIGIDFGTSTTAVSYASISNRNEPIQVDSIKFQQRYFDSEGTTGDLLPTAIAWVNNQLIIGEGVRRIKQKLKSGRNLWHSFKMKLGVDRGPEYHDTLLRENHPVATIERPLDAAKVFFRFVKQGIDSYIEEHQLPSNLRFAVSIPASFESNQRRDLLLALKSAGISIEERAFIDEPNAAFLSYIADFSANNPNSYQIPDGRSLKILVFDFGAGTCDISVLEIERGLQNLRSKNIAISRFVALGGNDIDIVIARDLLLPQVLTANQIESEELSTADQKRLIDSLLADAEKLKIKLCENISTQMVRLKLPKLAYSDERLKVKAASQFKLSKRTLAIPELSVSYAEFAELMTGFLDVESHYDTCNDDGNIISIFTPIRSALRKAGLNANDLDMILLIGGSAKNPYVQNALEKAFSGVEIERPRNLQIHVSRGAAIHSALLHGLHVDLIRPITSEPIYYLTHDGKERCLVDASTEIPCAPVRGNNLYPQRDGQLRLEIPLFVSSIDQLLHVIEIESKDSKGFHRSNQVSLQAVVNADKLVVVEVYIDGQLAQPPHYLNPFANRPVSSKEQVVYEALRAYHDSKARNNGRPHPKVVRMVANAYENAGNHLHSAEFYEELQQLEPHIRYETNICYHYSCAGRKKLSDEWAEIAYRKNPSAANAFNLALRKVDSDKNAYRHLMEEALEQDRNATYVMLVYGQFLKKEGDIKRAESLINRAFQILWDRFEAGELALNDYSRLIMAAKLVDRQELVRRVEQAQRETQTEDLPYDPDALLEWRVKDQTVVKI